MCIVLYQCHVHFVADTTHIRKNLKPDSVPSIFSWTPQVKSSALGRRERAQKRIVRMLFSASDDSAVAAGISTVEEVWVQFALVLNLLLLLLGCIACIVCMLQTQWSGLSVNLSVMIVRL